MIKIGHPPPIDPVSFRNPGAAVGVEIVKLARLQRLAAAGRLQRPQRVEFLLLLFCEHGCGQHTIDFVRHDVAPGVVLTVRPGQVQQFALRPEMDGRLMLIDPPFLSVPPDGRPPWPAAMRLPPPVWQDCQGIMTRIAADTAAHGADPLCAGLLRHRVETILHLLALHGGEGASAAPPPGRPAALVADLRRLIDRHYRDRHQVRWYADRLGYAERTLNRACLAASGMSARRIIDARVVLEAKRLLAHGDDSVVSIGVTLGFSEPTNFARFFRARTSVTPTAFRRAQLR